MKRAQQRVPSIFSSQLQKNRTPVKEQEVEEEESSSEESSSQQTSEESDSFYSSRFGSTDKQQPFHQLKPVPPSPQSQFTPSQHRLRPSTEHLPVSRTSGTPEPTIQEKVQDLSTEIWKQKKRRLETALAVIALTYVTMAFYEVRYLFVLTLPQSAYYFHNPDLNNFVIIALRVILGIQSFVGGKIYLN